ncbi:translation elongation factor G [Pirellula staleyi DSM 6068]|uniref:Elongation factor G n=1 Tax=Pirellula staleyi (strain ATCC 27377 / DSM 6068 / ICPB 4128) TaxID=530564 RepID=D2R5N4_PIRSD|nr:elongation factor G [Pirellula staleyi]ADB17216.1 translation elongation factor G [Pirellula staleyi DSM 6068]
MARQIQKIRNIGVIAHIDAGKTTVTERMLYLSGAKHRVGEVDKGTTETDSDPEEQQRGITIYAACVTFNWKDSIVNLLDTPGHVDFTAEVERCLRVLDGAVVVFSAREGVEAQSETVWRQADRYKVPRIAFINKLDREGADFEAVVSEMASRLGAHPVVVQIPVGQGPPHVANPFRAVIDLVSQKMLTFPGDKEGRTVIEGPVPPEMESDVAAWRDEMLEKLYNHDTELMELALAEEPLPEEMIRRALRTATLKMELQPVFCGSALHGIGVQPLLDGVGYYLPSPADMPPVEGESVADKKKKAGPASRKAKPDEPFSALVFKVLPAKTGDIHWCRIYSGSLKSNSRVLNPGKDLKENVAQLWHIHATKKEEQVESVECGDIVGVIGLRQSVTGDTLCDSKEPILLESIKFPETVISMAIEPENSTERKKLNDTLDMLKRQDPTLSVVSGETGQTLISGMGELHLEVIKNRLLRDFNLNVKFHKPQVSYRESIAHSVDIVGECNRMIAGQQLFARLTIRMEPAPEQVLPVAIVTQVPPDTLPAELLTAALDELKALGEGGGRIAGFPLMKLKVTILSGEWNPEQTDDRAMKIAASDAFEKGLEQGGRVLLEPIMKLDITTPEDYLGDFVGDLQQRRAVISKTENRGRMTVIEAHAPLRELFGYSSAMRSLSQGRAGASIEPLAYQPAPAEVLKTFDM